MFTLAEGNGMGSSCRYSYISGACANRHVDSFQCVGEEKCEFSGLNVLVLKKPVQNVEGCGHEKWLGLYCEKHRRFSCPGKEQCASPDLPIRQLKLSNGDRPAFPTEE